MDKMISHAHEINNVLQEYIKVHNDIFGISLRKLLPILNPSFDFPVHFVKNSRECRTYW